MTTVRIEHVTYIAYICVEHNGRRFCRKVELSADSEAEAIYSAEKYAFDAYAARSGTTSIRTTCVKLHKVTNLVKPHFVD